MIGVGCFLYVIASVLTIYAYKVADVSLLYPVTSFSYIWTVLLGWLFLKEKLNFEKVSALFIIIIGVVTLFL